MSEAKEVLRQMYRQKRLAMAPADVTTKSRIICAKTVQEIDWSEIKTLLVFESINSLNEVNTSDLARMIKAGHPDIRIVSLGSTKNTVLPADKFDLIFVPVLAFDKHNNRLGWGGGYYDRLLAQQPQSLKIGLCFHNGLVKTRIPSESHDIRMDKIITEI